MDNDKVYLLIPAFNPDQQLIILVRDLLAHHFHLLVINDGSEANCAVIFEQIAAMANTTVLHHPFNQGKGAALKTGFEYLLKYKPEHIIDVITVDADGQHTPQDVLAVTAMLLNNPNHVVLGTRQFSKNIPWRSRFGNILTRKLFKFLYGIELQDTQTGLRGIPFSLLANLLQLNSKRYEFEIECLIYFSKQKIPIQQIPISTIYINDNKSSHFNPVLDSLRIYFVFLRFLIISILSFIIDFSLFVILHLLGAGIFVSVFVARIISSLFNFYNNKFLVYKSLGSDFLKREAIGYTILALFIVTFSYLGISYLHTKFDMNVILAKVVIDAFLFIVSFIIQRTMIFQRQS